MDMSVREARAQFAAALAAAERVTITKHGRPIAELGPPTPAPKKKQDWESLDQLQEELGIPKADPSQAAVEIDWEVLLVHAQVLGAKIVTRDPLLLARPLAYHP